MIFGKGLVDRCVYLVVGVQFLARVFIEKRDSGRAEFLVEHSVRRVSGRADDWTTTLIPSNPGARTCQKEGWVSWSDLGDVVLQQLRHPRSLHARMEKLLQNYILVVQGARRARSGLVFRFGRPCRCRRDEASNFYLSKQARSACVVSSRKSLLFAVKQLFLFLARVLLARVLLFYHERKTTSPSCLPA